MLEPKTSTMTKLFHADTLEDLKDGAKRKQVAYVQSIPQFMTAPEGIAYSALDIPDERQAEGRQKAESLEIEILFKEDQYDELKCKNKWILGNSITRKYSFTRRKTINLVLYRNMLCWYVRNSN